MPSLTLVLADLYPARLTEAACASLPRLPALEQWLGRAELTAAEGGWRQALWSAASPASVAGAAFDAMPRELPLWMATPVHFVAGLDSLRLHPAGLLTLDLDEQRRLATDFAQDFAGSGWTLHATGRRELLLAGGAPGRVASRDPAWTLGADPSAGLPAGAGAAPLRRLGAELEMWLHGHAVNQARAARGLLSANALWLWGGGETRAVPPDPVTTGSMAWADDLFVDGLGRLSGARVLPRPSGFPAAASEARGAALCVCELGATPDAASLAALDADWMAPAFSGWRQGDYASATLLAGERAFRLQRGAFWRHAPRPWRRTRPWWEYLLQ